MKKAAEDLPRIKSTKLPKTKNTTKQEKSKVHFEGWRNRRRSWTADGKLLLTFNRGMLGSRILLLTV